MPQCTVVELTDRGDWHHGVMLSGSLVWGFRDLIDAMSLADRLNVILERLAAQFKSTEPSL